MKRTYNKAIATLTLIIMTLTMLLPLSANAAPATNNPPAGFNRGKLRVLEVYPSVMTNDEITASKDTSIPTKELYNKLKSKSEYEVTSMSMNKFISLRDDINGNYDIIYFAKGKYCRNTKTDTLYGNDITALRAGKVLDFINANQLVIIHNDALKEEDGNGNKTNPAQTIMYQKFNGFNTAAGKRNNVKFVSNIGDNVFKDLQAEYAKYNQSPILKVTKEPKSYRDAGSPISSHNLSFEYGVYDPDLDADDTLKVELYIDRNCNSLFEESEKVATRDIINGEYDTILFDMPLDYTGIFFWKLAVIDNAGAQSEKVDVFRLKGEEIEINVLQINPNVDSNANLADLFNKPVAGGASDETLGHRPGEFNITVTVATVDEFNNGLASKHLRDLNSYYDMVILGFADNYSDDREFNNDAIKELTKFIDSKQGVMFTHDSIHFKYNTKLTTNFNDDVGQSSSSGRGQTAGLLGFSGKDPKNNTIESNLHGEYSNYNNKYKLANFQTVNPYPDTANLVSPVNSNAITLYPYNLESEKPAERKVANTHYQWFKLDLEDENVIPLFNLYKEKSGERVNDDAMNNYYTYTKDNITYSGTGHASGYPDYEIKLFINTAIKAHAVANKKPLIEIIQPSGDTVNKTTPKIPLVFKLQDDYDTTLNYWIDVDYDNNGTYEKVIADGKLASTNVEISDYILDNRSTVGTFKIRIRAKEPRATGAESVLIKEMKCVNTPVLTPTVTFTNQSDVAITSCLIGETVKINTLITATGNLTSEQNVVPTYDVEGKYLDGTQILNKVNQNVGTFTFYPAMDPTPALGINKQETVQIKPDATTQLKVTAKAKHAAFGSPQEGIGTLNVNNGTVKIHVTDGVRNVKNVNISDNGVVKGQTGDAGTLTLYKLTGNHQYGIKTEDIPSGYKLAPGSITTKRMSDGNVTLSDSAAAVALSGENYYWEVTIKLTLDLGIHSKYYKMKSSGSSWNVAYLGVDGGNYYLRCPQSQSARYLTRIQIDEINFMKVQGIKFELETLDKTGNPVTSANAAKIIDTPVTLTGTIPADLNPATVKQLKANNDATGIPAGGTYANKTYYLVIEIPNADLQRVKIKKATLTFEDGTSADYVPSSSIIFGEPATPLLR